MSLFDDAGSFVERQVLQMVFDNSQFDRRIAQSSKTVEDFKKTMDFEETSKGLSEFSSILENISFERLSDNIEALANKFTGIGDAGEYVVSRIRASVEDAAKSVEGFVKSLTIDQVDIGQSKYDALNKAVMTITATGEYAEDQAYSVFERLMTYTNETSYSFADMVHQISAFTSAGQGLWESEKAMEGIANATAKAGQGVQQATSAMQVFAKAMGSGYLGKTQWDSLNLTARMITPEFRKVLVETAAEIGTLQKVGDKYRVGEAYRSDAALNAKDDLAKAEQKYNQKKTQANLERVEKLQKKVAQYDQQLTVTAKDLENSLHNKWLTNDVIMKALQKYYFEGIDDQNADWDTFAGSAAKAAQRALSLADAINAMKEASSAGWMTTFRLFWGDLSEAMVTFTNIANRVIEIIDNLNEWRNTILEVWAGEGGRFSITKILLGDYEQDVINGVYGVIDLFEKAGELIHNAVMDFFKLFVPEKNQVYWEDDGYQEAWLGGQLYNFTESISKFLTSIGEFFDGTMVMGNGEVKTRLQVFREIVDGIVGAVKLGYDLVTSMLSFMAQIGTQLGPSFDAITVFFSELGLAIYGSAQDAQNAKTIPEFFNSLAEEFRPFTEGVNEFVTALMEFLAVLLDLDQKTGTTKSFFASIGDFLKKAANIITTVGVPILTFFKEFFNTINELLVNGLTPENIQAAGVRLGAAFRVMLASLLQAIPNRPQFIQNWINSLLSVDTITEAAEPAKESLLGNLKKIIDDIFEGIRNLFISGGESFSLSGVAESIVDFVKTNAILQGAIDFFKNINLFGVIMAFLGVATVWSLWRLIITAKRAIQSVSELILSFGGGVAPGFVAKTSELSEAMLNIAKAVAIVSLAVTVLGSMKLDGVVQGVLSVIGVLGALFLFAFFISRMSTGEKFGDKFALAGQIMALAVFMASVAAGIALIMLAMTPLALQPDKFIVAVTGLVVILTAIGLLMFAIVGMSQNIGAKEYIRVTITILQLSILMAIISASISAILIAVIPIAALGWEKAAAGVIAIIGTLTAIATFTFALTRIAKSIQPKDIVRTIWGMLILSGSIAVISGSLSAVLLAVAPLASMGWETMAVGLTAIAGTMLIVSAFMYMMMRIMSGNHGISMVNSSVSIAAWAMSMVAASIAMAVSIAAIAVSLGLLMTAIIPLANLNPDSWVRGLLGLMVVLGSLLEFINAINHLKLKSLDIAGLGVFAGAVGGLIASLTPLSKMEWGGWARSMAGLFLILTMLALFMKRIDQYGLNSIKITGLAGFAAGLAVLILSLTPFATMNWEGFLRSFIGLFGVLTMLFIFMKKIDQFGLSSIKIVGLAGFALSISILMLSLKMLSNIPFAGLGTALLAMMGIMTLLLLFMKALDRYDIDATVKIAGMIAFGAGMWLMAQAFIPLAKLKMQEVIPGVVAFLGILTAFGLFLGAMNGLKMNLGGTISMFLIMITIAGLMLAFAFTINSLKDTDPWLILSYMVGLSALILVVGGLVAGLGAMGAGAGITGILVLAGALAAIIGVLALMVPMLIGGVADSLVHAGGQLALAAGTISIFTDRLKDISPTDADHASSIIGKLKDILETVSGISGYSESVSIFTTALYDLGTGLEIFNGHVKVLSDGNVTFAIQTIQDLAGCSDDLDKIAGMNIDTFTSNLTGMAGALNLYAIALNKAGEDGNETTPNVEEALRILREFSTALSEEGGFDIPDDMPDADSLGTFGAQLSALALAMVDFEKAGSQLGTGTKEALDALDFFADVKAKLTTIGAIQDVISFFTGEGVGKDAFTEFGKNIEQLGLSLSKFAESTIITDETTGEIRPLDFENAQTALQNFVDLKDKLPSIDPSWKTWWTGRSGDLTDLGSEIESAGQALTDFSSKAVEAVGTEEKKTAMNDALQMFKDISQFITDVNSQLPIVGGLANLFDTLWNGHKQSITDVATDMGDIGESLGKFGEGIAGKFQNKADVENAITAIRGFADILVAMSQMNDAYNVMGFSPTVLAGNLIDLIYFLNNGITEDDLSNNAIKNVSIIDSLVNLMVGISSKVKQLGGVDGEAIASFRDLAQSLVFVSQIDIKKDFTEVGMNIAAGVALGIERGQSKVVTAAANLITQALIAAREAGKIESPSREFFDLGVFIPYGLAGGIDSGAESVASSIENMTNDSISMASALMSEISRIMEEDTNAEPTITPVLDLTNIREGITYMNENLNDGNLRINASTPLSYANSINGHSPVGSENQNGTDLSGVYERMGILGEQITELGEAIKKMKFVLNTGVIAGEITDQIDINLGRRSYYSGRRN